MIPFVLLQTQQSLPFLCSRKCFCIPALRNLLLWARVYFSRLYSPLGQEPHLIYYPICYTSCTQLSSVAQSCPTLCDPMDRSMPGLPVHHQLPEFNQTHVHWVGDAISSAVVPFSSCPQSFPASGSFQMNQLFTSGGQSIGVSALVLQKKSGLISFRTDWLDCPAGQGTLRESSPAPQFETIDDEPLQSLFSGKNR